MNVENLQKVIDAIRAEEIAKFDLSDWCVSVNSQSCGTAACIAGFAALLDDRYEKVDDGGDWVFVINGHSHDPDVEYFTARDVAVEFLEVYGYITTDLFTPRFKTHRMADVTPAQAIKVLEHLRDTGEINWSVAGLEQ